MIFSIIPILLLLIGFFWWRKTRPKYFTFYLEPSTPSLLSYKTSEKTKNRYFPHSLGVIDLSKHPKLLRFKETIGSKEYLIEPWDREGNLYIEEGKTKVVVFEFLRDPDDNIIAAIPCLRLVETLIEEENDDPLLGYKSTFLGVCWDEGRKMVSSENLLGVVKYESV